MAELSVEGMLAFGRGDAEAIVPDGTSFADRRGWDPGSIAPASGWTGRGSLMSTQARNSAVTPA